MIAMQRASRAGCQWCPGFESFETGWKAVWVLAFSSPGVYAWECGAPSPFFVPQRPFRAVRSRQPLKGPKIQGFGGPLSQA